MIRTFAFVSLVTLTACGQQTPVPTAPDETNNGKLAKLDPQTETAAENIEEAANKAAQMVEADASQEVLKGEAAR